MTKTTEELKREMYDRLADVKNSVANRHVPGISLDRYESSFEAYLEALRQELQMWKDIADERDLRSATLRNKLQAFEFANRSAAELLSEALREPSGLRKWSPCAPARRSAGSASCDIPDALLICPAHFIQTNCNKGHHFMVNSSGPEGGTHCLACGYHREIPR